MDIIEMLKGLNESLTDCEMAERLEEIGVELEKMGDSADNPDRASAYRIAAIAVGAYGRAFEDTEKPKL